jgi:multidrug efflux pump subunit AcrA (membrane-fusion protein)
MNRLQLFTVCLLLASCTAQAQNPGPTPSPSPSSLIPVPSSPAPSVPSGSKRFTLRLTLTDKEDLKVKEGDVVVKDQILADRTRDRQRLEAQKQQISIQLQRLRQSPIQPLAPKRIPDVAAFPAPSFLEEQATIDRR